MLPNLYPFQVALAPDQCGGKNMELVGRLCGTFSAQPQIRSVRCACRECLLFCFANDADAQIFNRIFGGEYLANETRSTDCGRDCRPQLTSYARRK
jgi:hypothetical protein